MDSRARLITCLCIFGRVVSSRQAREKILIGMLGDMGVIDGDAKVIITADSEGFVHADTVHRDQHVQRHIVALQLFGD